MTPMAYHNQCRAPNKKSSNSVQSYDTRLTSYNLFISFVPTNLILINVVLQILGRFLRNTQPAALHYVSNAKIRLYAF